MAQFTSDKPVRLIINADVCDARRVREENYSMYEAIIINSGMLIVNEQSKGILNRLNVSINSDNTVELPEGEDIDPDIQTITGPYKISAGMSVSPHTMLTVTGPLTIERGAGDILKNIDKITLTGPLLRPQSLGSAMPILVHTGPTIVYPDDCILLDSRFVVDKFFALRAKDGGKYFAAKKVIFSPDADLVKLSEKKVFFQTERLIMQESQVEAVAGLSDEQAEFTVLPDGTRYFDEDVTIDENFLKCNGGSLYVDGDLTFDPQADANKLCPMITRLIVRGTLTITNEQESAYRSLGSVECNELIIKEKGNRHVINDLASLYLDRQTLENFEEGVTVSDVATLTIDPEIPIELIFERLKIDDVAHVRCSTVQAGAIGSVSHDVAAIRGVPAEEVLRSRKPKDTGTVGSPQSGGLIGGLMNTLFGTPDYSDEPEIEVETAPASSQEQPGVRLINADRYVL